MSEETHHGTQRHCDVAVIGGSAAGLGAALQLGRQRRSVAVIDAGDPRNAPAARMHSYLGHEGLPPTELSSIAREEVRSYGGEILAGRAVDVTLTDDDRFRVALTGGHAVIARRVVAATGIVDDLPDIEGLAEHWGTDVIHCPFCHGYEVRDQRIVMILSHRMGLHPASLYWQLTDELTLVLHDGVDADDPELAAFTAAGVRVIDARATRVIADDGRVTGLELADGTRVDADAIGVTPRFRIRDEPFASLGLAPSEHPTGLGDHIATAPNGETSVPGLYAAGNLTDPSQQVLQAAANGSRVGAMVAASLAHDDIEAAARRSGNEADWDHRYGSDRLWSGNPNGTLVTEVEHLDPGRALDVGAGEGADAVWLAERGWKVTASDISQRGLDRVAAAATDRGVQIERLHMDANTLDAFDAGAFDLVSAQYASIPRTRDGRGVTNVLNAVAPGGTLIVVSHDLAPMRAPVDTTETSRAFDADAYVRVEDFAAAVGDSPEWTIEVHEKRPRPPGSASGHHHVDDIVLRVRRSC